MDVPKAVSEIQGLSASMAESTDVANIAATRYAAHMSLYNAACQVGDMKEIEAQRLIIHAQVDAILDAGFEVYTKQRKINEIARSVTEF